MGNCFSSCFPKKTTLFRRSFEAGSEEEDPETVALREESENAENVRECVCEKKY